MHELLVPTHLRTTDPEDMESKYQKMVSATLLAWRALMSALRPDQLAELTTPIKAVLDHAKLWKHAKSTNPMVRPADLFHRKRRRRSILSHIFGPSW